MSLLHIGRAQIDFAKRLLSVVSDSSDARSKGHRGMLKINIGCALSASTQIAECILNENSLLIGTDDGIKLTINYDNEYDFCEKYEISWKSTISYHYMKDVIDTDSGGYWYGGPEMAQQKWPTERNTHQFSVYLPLDTLKDCARTPSGMERYWLCSNKFAIYVPDEIPLWTEHNDGRLSLQAQITDSPYIAFHDSNVAPTLSYTIYAAKQCTLREFHIAVHKMLYETCTSIPDESLIRKPIWTTWARYKENVTQNAVLNFAREIIQNEAPISQLELDDCWASNYGDFEFDKEKFPDIKGMCKQLSDWNIRLTLWIHPFVNLKSNNGKNPALRHLFVKDLSGQPGTTEWWHGEAYVIDLTNPEAEKWFRQQLEIIKELGIYSFKFDAGEISYLPKNMRLYSGNSPNDFTTAYVRTAASFGSAIEVRIFHCTQKLPIFYRTMDRSSSCGTGLDTLIPVVLNFSLHGYYYNLPDMIGGNGELCSKELFIRWMQANQFLLSMQFSYCPWQYDNQLCNLFNLIMKKREEFVDFLLEACRKSCSSSEPVLRPLWWLSEDQEALCCGDQFVIDDTMIVAPILTEGATSRPVFLPPGTWKYELTNQCYKGPCKISVEAPLLHHAPPYFTRIN